MWDEEGLEHLGGLAGTPGSNTTHRIGSFDSDLNSVVSSGQSRDHQEDRSFGSTRWRFMESHNSTFI